MSVYYLETEQNGGEKQRHPTSYKTVEEAVAAMKRLAVKAGKQMEVSSYLSAIRKGENQAYRRALANGLKRFFSEKETFGESDLEELRDVVEELRDAPAEEFTVQFDGSLMAVSFSFGEKFYLELDFGWSIMVYMKDRRFSYHISVAEESETNAKKSNSANILHVYNTLSRDAKAVKTALENSPRIPPNIRRGRTASEFGDSMTAETVTHHIGTLQKLGIPITRYRISQEEKAFWQSRGLGWNEGYEMDPHFVGKIPPLTDAGRLGVGVNPLLVLFVLMAADKPLRQGDIIREMGASYKVSIARAAVSRHLGLLPVVKTGHGYILVMEDDKT